MQNESVLAGAMVGDEVMPVPPAMAQFGYRQQFMREWHALTYAEHARFAQAWRQISASLDTTGQLPGPPLVDKLTQTRRRNSPAAQVIYEVRWDNSNAHKRATFHLEQDTQGRPVVVWRRIGDHNIYTNP